MLWWTGTEREDGAAEFVTDGYGEGFFCHGVWCDWRETGKVWSMTYPNGMFGKPDERERTWDQQSTRVDLDGHCQ